MSDRTINHFRPSLKVLNARFKKLRWANDRMEILAHHQKRLIQTYKELSLQCTRLAENMEHMDVIAFEMRQHLDYIKAEMDQGD